MHPKSFSEHAERIARRGRSFVGVFPCEGDDGHAFSYTIGNHLRGLPELLIVGDCRALGLDALSQLMITQGRVFDDGELVYLSPDQTLPLKLIKASRVAHAEYTLLAGDYLGHEDYAVMQVVMADARGRLPGEPGCEKPYSDYPVLRVT